jgi:hypothetical protein
MTGLAHRQGRGGGNDANCMSEFEHESFFLSPGHWEQPELVNPARIDRDDNND